ncbi:hypothetical protein [Flaviaesturariibacter amylovorans]|uniref:Tyr recombinase domain-containing protein n=1 Tax=Flaviaesturariibacter amylovorans TaxID=1084520 RepID=A0ABP8GR04_9BACT
MKDLPNGCFRSEIVVTPKDWKKSAKSVKKDWRIYYRFYDPTNRDERGRIKPMLVQLKHGVNRYKDVIERRIAVDEIIKDEAHKLDVLGFNPITGQYAYGAPEIIYEIDPYSKFIPALRAALVRLHLEERTRRDMKYVIDAVEKAAKQLRYWELPISQIARRHIKTILTHLGAAHKPDAPKGLTKITKAWTATTYNRYRAYLMMLFKELVECEAVTANPVRDVSEMKIFKKLRAVLTDEQRTLIDEHLAKVAPRFHMFVNLFFHSGGRPKELLQLRAKDVDLSRQVYRSVVKKGRSAREVERTIKTVSLPFWRFFLEDCAPEQFLFCSARGRISFVPGDKAMTDNIPGDWWRRHVKAKREKGGLGIDIDLYSLKHLNASETVTAVGEEAAAEQMGHLGTDMVRNVYDVTREKREHARLKAVRNAFAPKAPEQGEGGKAAAG